jgi:DDE_Tnp_1-associated
MTLLQAFENVPEFRRSAGMRHPLPCVLVCVLLATLSGCTSWRDMGDFAQRHREALVKQLRLPKDRVPSYSTLRRVLLRLDFDKLSETFTAWARQRVEIEDGEWLAMDGKSLRGTVTDPHDEKQNFKAVVSLYLHKRGVVLHSQAFESKEGSEAHVVEAILAELASDLEGAGVTLDALHCRKKLAT